MKSLNGFKWIILLACVYLIIQIIQLNNFGFHSVEEYLFGRRTLGVITNNEVLFSDDTPSLKFLGRRFPLIASFYQGGLEYYFYLPFLLFFGGEPISLKIGFIFVGLMILFFSYLFVRGLFNRTVAILSVILLILNINFILMPKLGIYINALLQVWIMSFLYFIYQWYRKKNNAYFYLSMFIFGLALSTRIQFLWIISALLFYSIVTKDILRLQKLFNLKIVLSALFFLSLGDLLMIIFNLQNNFITLKTIVDFSRYSTGGVNNLSYIRNLAVRLDELKYLLSSGWILDYLGLSLDSRVFNFNILYKTLVFSVCWLAFAPLFFRKHLYFSFKKRLLILTLLLITFLQSPITLSTFCPTHLFILFPFIQIAIAIVFYEFINFFKKNKFAMGVLILIFLIISSYDLRFFCTYQSWLVKNGEEGAASSAGQKLSEWLIQHGHLAPLPLDPVVRHQLLFLSKGKISPKSFEFIEANVTAEYKTKFLKENFIRSCQDYFADERNVYIFNLSNPGNCLGLFAEIAESNNRRIVKVQEISQDNGKIVYAIYKIKNR